MRLPRLPPGGIEAAAGHRASARGYLTPCRDTFRPRTAIIEKIGTGSTGRAATAVVAEQFYPYLKRTRHTGARECPERRKVTAGSEAYLTRCIRLLRLVWLRLA